MTSQVFYRKWRPQTLTEIVGQEHITQTLRNALLSGRVSHAYLFCGPRGTGKTSTGRILAKAVNCLNPVQGEPCNTCSLCQAINEGRALDVIEIDAASNRGIDEIRDLREKVNYAPNLARYKVYIIDEVHMLTEPASNALLKTLEEPPSHAIFVLATTEPHKVLPTIISRCQRFDFRRLSQSAIMAKLSFICGKENIDIEPEALRLIARAVAGSLRDAENLLEQLVAYYGHKIQLKQAQALLGISGDLRIVELARYIVQKDISAGLQVINNVNNDGVDLRQFTRGLVDYLRCLLLVKSGSEEIVDVTGDELREMKSLVAEATLDYLLRAVKLFSAIELRFDNYSPLPLEMALVDCVLASAETLPSPKTKGVEEAKVATSAEELSSAKVKPLSAGKDIEYFRRHWKEFIQSLRGEGSSGNLDAFLRSACEPVSLEGNTLVLGFYYRFHKEKIEDPKYQYLIKRKLKEVFGQPYELRCILISRDKKTSSQNELKSSVIRAALEMGAKIVESE